MAKQDVTIEAFYDDAWNEIAAYTRTPLSITHGRGDEASEPTASTTTLTLDNRDGSKNPANPTSELYGKIGRNTPIRVRMTGEHSYGEGYLLVKGDPSRAETPDAAVLDITGDIDIRIDAQLTDWTNVGLAAKYLTTGNQRSWGMWTDGQRVLHFAWSPDGTVGAVISKVSDDPLPVAVGERLAIRVTLDVNNGAAGNTLTFYTADTIDGPWTQFGDPVITAGTTSIHAGTAPLEVGDASLVLGSLDASDGRIYEFQLRSGIDGTVVANPDFTNVVDGGSFTDGSGLVWSEVGTAQVVPASIRHMGEAAAWKPRRTPDFDINKDDRGDAWVEVTASGVLRRVGQPDEPLRSALTRSYLLGYVSSATFDTLLLPVAYWPLEDERGSIAPASALPAVPPMRTSGTIEFASAAPIPGSVSILKLADAAAGLDGVVGKYPTGWVNTDGSTITWIFAIGSETAGAAIMSTVVHDTAGFAWNTTCTLSGTTDFTLSLRRWAIETPGSITTIDSSTFARPAGSYYVVHLLLTQSGANINATWWWSNKNGPLLTGSVVGTLGSIRSVHFDADATLNQLLLGHVVVYPDSGTDVVKLHNATLGNAGETDAERIARLCLEEGIPFTLRSGSSADGGVPMGVQPADTLTNVLAECERTGDGLLYEPRNALGLEYRTAKSIYNQASVLDLLYTELAPVFEYDIDDLNTKNDITASRPGGSSARVVQETGPLNVQPPTEDPDGVGRVVAQLDFNPPADSDLDGHARWALHKGVVTEPRYPRVTVDLDAYPELVESVSAVRHGDLITISELPAEDSPDVVRLIVVGDNERIESHHRVITFNCMPASPYDVGVLDDDTLGLLGSDGSTTNASFIAGGATSLSVAVAAGYPLWVTGAVDFDVMVFGVRLHVTNIAGGASPQTFTVDQTPVNGVTKTIPAGKRVDLFQPTYIGL